MEEEHPQQPGHRGKAIMSGSKPDQRAVRRYYLGMTAQVQVPSEDLQHNAYIRDWSWAGMFLYSHWVPNGAAPVELLLSVTNGEKQPVQVRCMAEVVRVERGVTGAATGLALAFSSYEVLRQQLSREPRLENLE